MNKICFVCHGNICRSVSAQYILQDMVRKKNIADRFFIDSAATSTEEIGNPIYPPMEQALREMHIPIGEHCARQLRRSDYERYDLLIGMDEENMYYMRRILGQDPSDKIHYLMEYTDRPSHKIEDPWYTRKFRLCAEEITEGCRGLLAYLLNAAPPELTDRKVYDTPIGPVCMSKTEHEAYLEARGLANDKAEDNNR